MKKNLFALVVMSLVSSFALANMDEAKIVGCSGTSTSSGKNENQLFSMILRVGNDGKLMRVISGGVASGGGDECRYFRETSSDSQGNIVLTNTCGVIVLNEKNRTAVVRKKDSFNGQITSSSFTNIQCYERE